MGMWVHDFSNYSDRERLCVGGYVGMWVHDFSNFSGRGDAPMSWICGYRDTRVSKLFWPGGSLHMIADTWYTAFKLFWPGAVDGSG